MPDWKIFTGDLTPHNGIDRLPEPPPWRPYGKGAIARERTIPEDGAATPFGESERGKTFRCTPAIIEMVNAALYLRRPLLVTGKPGTGKSSLIYAVAHELKLGAVLRWSVTSRTTLRQGLYEYDAIGRLQETQLRKEGDRPEIGKYLKLGPLGTALLPTRRPWALLIDEIDKADIDLPNDLLHIFEEGEFEIPELARHEEEAVEVRGHVGDETFPITKGRVRCHQFPFVVMTNNGEREFPPPFLRRCLRLDIATPDPAQLAAIVKAHLGEAAAGEAEALIARFHERIKAGTAATDQLLNAVHLVVGSGLAAENDERERLVQALMRELSVFAEA